MAVEYKVFAQGGQNANIYIPYYVEVIGDGSGVILETPGFEVQFIAGVVPVDGGSVSGLKLGSDGVVSATINGRVHFSFMGITKNQ